MIIIDISIFVDMLCMKLAILALIVIIATSGISSAFAAQLSWDTRTPEKALEPKFIFQRTVTIDYNDGGIIADELQGKKESVFFVADGSSPEIAQLIEKLNKQLEQSGTTARISDLKIDYSAQLTGYDTNASIEYDIIMIPVIENFLIQEYSSKGPSLFDVSWRGLSVHEPIIISDYDITKPLSLFQSKFPQTYEKILGTGAEGLLSESIVDASGIQTLSLAKWHSLFDPTSVVVDATRYGFKGEVVTTFSMGTSDIFNPTKEKIQEVEFVADKPYRISTFEAADSAVLFIPGYASAGMLGGYEIIQTGPKPPFGVTPITPKEQFPIFVMYGMAGMAAAGAGGFFWWSSKKAKKETKLGQTGIDPSKLRGVETSSASGGYHTNRGEAQLVDESDYTRTKSVYSEPTKRTMPKGWQDK